MLLNNVLQAELLTAVNLPVGFLADVEMLWAPLAELILARRRSQLGVLVVGLNGPQGSGKSTGAAVLDLLLRAKGVRVAVLSIDDLYLGSAARLDLAERVHPLFATRGPPGTHDTGLGIRTFDGLARAARVAMPRFDKAADDPFPKAEWPVVDGPVDVVIFEGWCLGARPQPPSRLAIAENELELNEDPGGAWRQHSNEALAQDYQTLFGRIGFLVQLRAPSFDAVLGWRQEQEHKLNVRTGKGMSAAEVGRFVQHYERLTRWIDTEMPARADVVVQLDEARQPVAVRGF